MSWPVLELARRRWRWLAVGFSALFAAIAAAPAWALSSCTTTTNSTSGVSSTTCAVTIPGIAHPTGGASALMGTGVVSWVTTVGIPVFFGLIALAIVLRLVVKLVKRGSKAIA